MRSKSDYIALITSWLRTKPNFVATVTATVSAFADVQSFLSGLPTAFDIDTAIGAQLDAIGVRVGRSRYITTPLPNNYFSLDTAGLGLDQGYLQGRYDPTQGITSLDDETYRLVLRAKIASNNWDGRMAGAITILGMLFNSTTTPGTVATIRDNQDMTMTVALTGTVPPPIYTSLLTGGYIPIKPAGVQINYIISPGGPIFGLDVENSTISGLDVGALA